MVPERFPSRRKKTRNRPIWLCVFSDRKANKLIVCVESDVERTFSQKWSTEPGCHRDKHPFWTWVRKKSCQTKWKHGLFTSLYFLFVFYVYLFRHPNIVQFYTYFHDRQNIYILMEFLPGGDLFTALQNQAKKKFSEQL